MKHIKIIILLASLALAGGCDQEHSTHDSSDDQNEHAGHASQADHPQHDHESMPHDEPTDLSLYHLSSEWTTHEGKTITLQDLTGTVQVLAMVYTTCQYACPRIVADLKEIESKLQEKDIDNEAHFVLVTIDPKVDTVARLKKFAKENNLASGEWTLLNGNEDNILELAALLGVKYKKTSATDYAHSNVITVLNQEGEIAYQQIGLGNDPTKTVEVIATEIAKQSR